MVEFEEVVDAADGKQQQKGNGEIPPSQERFLDAQEIEKVAATLTRPTARMHLESLAKKLYRDCENLKRVEASHHIADANNNSNNNNNNNTEDEKKTESSTSSTGGPVPTNKPQPATAPAISKSVQYVPIDKFAFDDGGYNSAFVTLYIDLPGVGSIPSDNIKCEFKENSFDFVVKDLKGKSYRLYKDNLENNIDVMKSTKKVKADKILIKLAKKKTDYGSYEHWSALTSKKKKNIGNNNKKDDPASGIMDLMKEMYDSGDDNMRKVIGETMMKQREGKLGTEGMGGGLGDMDMDI